ncbi:MAG: M15 family metallopeptidase [Bacteroidota bacterium]
MNTRLIGFFLLLLSVVGWHACQSPSSQPTSEHTTADTLALVDTSRSQMTELVEALKPDTTDLERTLIAQGLVSISSVAPDIVEQIMYSTEDNFLDADVYGDFDACYLQPNIAAQLAEVQACIKLRDSRMSLVVFDCVRPRSVQFQMWEIVKGTDQQNYVAPPTFGGSMHNYGAAVDLGLIHLDTGLVDMGTPFDYFGKLAQPRHEEAFLKSGELSAEQISNRRYLRACMLKAGFHGILSEWWHFVGRPNKEVRQTYQIVE